MIIDKRWCNIVAGLLMTSCLMTFSNAADEIGSIEESEAIAQADDLQGFKRSPENPEIYIHTASGIVFPPTLYVFQREKIHHFDNHGVDISVGYNFIGASLTIYVYPLPVIDGQNPEETWKTVFSAEVQGVQQQHNGAQLLSAEQGSMPVGGVFVPEERLQAFRARFQMMESNGTTDLVKSELLSFRKGQQLVKMRLTYLEESQERIIREFEWVLKEFQWPSPENIQ